MKRLFILISVLACLRAQSQSSLETVIQKGHELAVISVAASPDSSYVATGSKDKSIKLWEVSTRREVRSFLGHEMSVTCIAFSPDGKQLLSGSSDKTIRLWDVSTGRQLQKIETEDYMTDVAFDPKNRYIATVGYHRGGYGDYAFIYDLKTLKLITKLEVTAEQGRGFGVAIAFSPNGEWIALGEDNRVVKVHRVGSWEKKFTFDFQGGWCGGCSTIPVFTPDSKFLWMASHNGPLKQYELNGGKLVKTIERESKELTDLAISPDGKLIARATEYQVKIWNEQTGKAIDSIAAPEDGVFHEITFSNDSKSVLISSDNNTAFAYHLPSRKISYSLTGFLNQRDKGGLNYDPNFYWESSIAKYVRLKNKLMITNDGKHLIKGKFGRKIKRWDIATGKTMMDYTAHEKASLAYDLTADGTKLVSGGGDGKIILWNVNKGDTVRVINSYREPIFDIQFNRDEDRILSCSWDATLKIHDATNGKLLTYLDFETNSAYNARFHPNGLYVATARLDNSLQLWELDTKSAVRNFTGHTDIISSIQFTRNGSTLMSAAWDGSIRLWDVPSGLMTSKFRENNLPVYAAIFNKEETAIFAGGADRVIRLWDIQSGKVLRTFEGHQAEVTSLLLSPDNKMLISHSVDGVTKFWDLTTGKEFFEHIHLAENDWMVKNPEGYFNGTDGARKFIHFVSGLKTFSVDQFFNDFYRPDLLPKIFNNRGGDESKSIQGKLKNSPPPTVKVAITPSSGNKAELFIRIVDNGAGAQSLKLFHNGKRIVLTSQDIKYPMGKDQFVNVRQAVELIGGTNTFSVTASNKDGLESDAASAEIFSDHSSKSSICHILAVGINAYKNQKMVLNYAKPDAASFSQLLDNKSEALFKSMQLHTLYDEQATRANILKKLDELASTINQEDVFIFYYAGHGSMVDNRFYFIPTESSRLYDASALSKEAIEAELLQDKFKNIRALKQLIIMDACQSGGSVELLATRGATEEKAIAQLSRSAGIHVMASAGSEQFATEFAELGHGLFTYVLIRALQGEADGAPKDGKVTIYELKSFIDDQVPEMTKKLKGKPQYPYTFSRGQDFPIVME